VEGAAVEAATPGGQGRALPPVPISLSPARDDHPARRRVLPEPLRAKSLRYAVRAPADPVEIVSGPLGDRAEVMGALALRSVEPWGLRVGHG
jgi:hypothetical protein